MPSAASHFYVTFDPAVPIAKYSKPNLVKLAVSIGLATEGKSKADLYKALLRIKTSTKHKNIVIKAEPDNNHCDDSITLSTVCVPVAEVKKVYVNTCEEVPLQIKCTGPSPSALVVAAPVDPCTQYQDESQSKPVEWFEYARGGTTHQLLAALKQDGRVVRNLNALSNIANTVRMEHKNYAAVQQGNQAVVRYVPPMEMWCGFTQLLLDLCLHLLREGADIPPRAVIDVLKHVIETLRCQQWWVAEDCSTRVSVVDTIEPQLPCFMAVLDEIRCLKKDDQLAAEALEKKWLCAEPASPLLRLHAALRHIALEVFKHSAKQSKAVIDVSHIHKVAVQHIAQRYNDVTFTDPSDCHCKIVKNAHKTDLKAAKEIYGINILRDAGVLHPELQQLLVNAGGKLLTPSFAAETDAFLCRHGLMPPECCSSGRAAGSTPPTLPGPSGGPTPGAGAPPEGNTTNAADLRSSFGRWEPTATATERLKQMFPEGYHLHARDWSSADARQERLHNLAEQYRQEGGGRKSVTWFHNLTEEEYKNDVDTKQIKGIPVLYRRGRTRDVPLRILGGEPLTVKRFKVNPDPDVKDTLWYVNHPTERILPVQGFNKHYNHVTGVLKIKNDRKFERRKRALEAARAAGDPAAGTAREL